MFRKTVWRNGVTDSLSWQQDQALSTTIFILKQYGPTGYLLKEQGETKNYKVCLGDTHTCTCPTFHKEKDLCKHIFWVLMRRFRLPREHEYCFQQGLVERQILELLQGLDQTQVARPEKDPERPSDPLSAQGEESVGVKRKPIHKQDVCPICQEELLEKRLPVAHCRFGCGNNVHISCMRVWAEHQSRLEAEPSVKCPLCREDFSPHKLLQQQVRNAAKLLRPAEREKPDRHLGLPCNRCGAIPITGTCYKCTVCDYFHLCELCVRRGCHQQHQLLWRTTRQQPWCSESQADPQTLDQLEAETDCPTQTDSPVACVQDSVPEDMLKSLPAQRVTAHCSLLEPGQQCRICLQDFTLGQTVKTLPCRHKFHSDCVSSVLRSSNCCPLEGWVVYNPLTWPRAAGPSPSSTPSLPAPPPPLDLLVPGVGLLQRTARDSPGGSPSHGALNLGNGTAGSRKGAVSKSRKATVSRSLSACLERSFQGLCINTVDSSQERRGLMEGKEQVEGRREEEERKRGMVARRSEGVSRSGGQLCRGSSLLRLSLGSLDSDRLGVGPTTRDPPETRTSTASHTDPTLRPRAKARTSTTSHSEPALRPRAKARTRPSPDPDKGRTSSGPEPKPIQTQQPDQTVETH